MVACSSTGWTRGPPTWKRICMESPLDCFKYYTVFKGAVHYAEIILGEEYMAHSTKGRWFNDPVVRGASYYFGYWGVVGFYVPFLNVYFLRIGLSGAQIGIFSTLLPLLMLTIAPFLASLADRWRARVRILAFCIAMTGFTILLLGVSTNYWVLLLLMVLMSIVRSPIAGIGDGLVAKMAVTHNVNFGAMRMWGSFGFAAIAIISGISWEKLGYQPMFVVACLGFLPVAWLATRLDEEAAAP
ncbi:MAG: MFS transporter, partial [Chloroflexia bacterium]|nr:MFS transporter [Chloroflexia bacterium]